MISMILTAILTMTSPKPATTAQVQTCVWPNRCVEAPVVAAGPVTTCVWPNVCG